MTHPNDGATKSDIIHVNGRIDNLDTDIKSLQLQTRTMGSKIEDLGTDVRRLEVLQEEMNAKLDAMLEILAPKMEDITAHGNTLDNHEDRITGLERLKRAAI